MKKENPEMSPFYDLIFLNGGRIRVYCETDGIDDAWEEMTDAFASQSLWHVGAFSERNGWQLEATFNGEAMEAIDMAKVIGYQ